MAGPLGVSHLLLFSRSASSSNPNLRIALTPRGPTLHFKVEKYSLCKDVTKVMKHPKGGSKEYLTAPLLVMNNFTTSTETPNASPIPKNLEQLMTTIFQSLFPPISPQTTPLSSIRRILLLNREIQPPSSTSTKSSDSEIPPYVLNLRHYAITTRRTSISRRIRRLDPSSQSSKDRKKKSLPNLGRLDDMADYLLDPASGGLTSASESEVETDAEVEVLATVARKVLNKKDLLRQRNGGGRKEPSRGVEKHAVKLVELGPRMRLRMVKVEEGVCEGRVMWHEYINKSKMEEKELDEVWRVRREEKERRRREQRENVEKKRKERGSGGKAEGEGGEDEDMEDAWDSEDFDEQEDGEGDIGEE